MKFLLELFFSFLFFGLFIAFLPTIIGIISLCAIVVFFLSLLKNFFSGDEGTAGETERCEDYVKVNIETEDRNKREEQERTGKSSEKTDRYSGYRHYSRTCNYDDDYYDDWRNDDMPPEEGDGFRGTGAPFL